MSSPPPPHRDGWFPPTLAANFTHAGKLDYCVLTDKRPNMIPLVTGSQVMVVVVGGGIVSG